jgi:hypothetical protein
MQIKIFWMVLNGLDYFTIFKAALEHYEEVPFPVSAGIVLHN